MPTVAIHTVGAGGGSIAWGDEGGALRVGPRSAGADPGPGCLRPWRNRADRDRRQRGAGSDLRRSPGWQASWRLEGERAVAALQALGGRLGLDAVAAALGIAASGRGDHGGGDPQGLARGGRRPAGGDARRVRRGGRAARHRAGPPPRHGGRAGPASRRRVLGARPALEPARVDVAQSRLVEDGEPRWTHLAERGGRSSECGARRDGRAEPRPLSR